MSQSAQIFLELCMQMVAFPVHRILNSETIDSSLLDLGSPLSFILISTCCSGFRLKTHRLVLAFVYEFQACDCSSC
ncbi:hypothetical protein LINGRAHAP2_LOCUS15040 [Linum grandiflorum]